MERTEVPAIMLAGSRRATSASTSCCMPPRSAVKMAAPLLDPLDELFDRARILRCAANMPRVSEPYCRSISTMRGKHGLRAELRRIAAVDSAEQRIGEAIDRFATESAARQAQRQIHRWRAGRGGCSSSSAMRTLVRRLKSRVSAVGNELGGHEEHEPVGQRHEPVAYDDPGFARGVVGGISWAPRPSSRQSSAAAGFSVRKESGPRSSTAPLTISEASDPPSRGRCSKSVYSTGAPAARAFLELIGRSQPGNSTANDRDPHLRHNSIIAATALILAHARLTLAWRGVARAPELLESAARHAISM